MVEKISYQELVNTFRKHEASYPKEHLLAHIVFTEVSFDKPYSLEARTYAVSSNNKAFQPNKGGYSIYGSSLDGTDLYVRLERYVNVEHGGKDGWAVDYCYLVPHYTVEQTSDAFADPFIIRDNFVPEGRDGQYYSVGGIYQTFESEEAAQKYIDTHLYSTKEENTK